MWKLSWVLLAALLPSGHSQAQVPPAAPLQVDDDGTVQVPTHAVPPSAFLSPEARAYLRDHLRPDPALLRGGSADGVPPLIAGYLNRQREVYPVSHATGVREALAASITTWCKRLL